MAAENALKGCLWFRSWCFNEAAANGRGKRVGGGAPGGRSWRFNEAAANGRGKPDLRDKCLADAGASMRPRRMAAENLADLGGGGDCGPELQ